ncbi:MAG: cellulase family glycosylhydrolase [Bacteroidetes bacterium]|nr:cellulase family glycosylhydrolase [Bacteroidota bacterium]
MTSVVAFNHLSYSMINIIASRFKNRGDELSAYEVMGEPVIQQKSGGKTPPQLENFFANVLQTIRKVDKERWFLLSPGPWGKPTNYIGFDGFNIQDDRIIYNAHMYLPDQFTHQGIRTRPKGVEYPGRIKGEHWDRKMVEEKLAIMKKISKETQLPNLYRRVSSGRWSKGS